MQRLLLTENTKTKYESLLQQAFSAAAASMIFSEGGRQELAEAFSSLQHFIANFSVIHGLPLSESLERHFNEQCGGGNQTIEELMISKSRALTTSIQFKLKDRLHALKPHIPHKKIILSDYQKMEVDKKSDSSSDGALQKIQLQDFTIEDILTSARITLEETGQRPIAENTTILYGPLANENITWRAVNQAIRNKTKPFENGNYTNMANLFEQSNVHESLHYYIKSVLDSARATLKETGQRPSKNTGEILYGPLAAYGIMWSSVNSAIMNKMGDFKNYNYARLSDCLEQSSVYEKMHYYIKNVIASARATLEETGQRPSENSGEVLYGPLAGYGITWLAVHKIILNKKSEFEDCHYTGLPDCLEKNSIYKKLSYYVENVLASARTTLEETGQRPTWNTGEMLYGPLVRQDETWRTVNSDIVKKRGEFKNYNYEGLADCFEQNDIYEKIYYYIVKVAASIQATIEETGQRPSKGSGEILYGPLAGHGITWSSINSAIINKMGDFKNYSYTGLPDYLNKCNIPRKYIKEKRDVAVPSPRRVITDFKFE